MKNQIDYTHIKYWCTVGGEAEDVFLAHGGELIPVCLAGKLMKDDIVVCDRYHYLVLDTYDMVPHVHSIIGFETVDAYEAVMTEMNSFKGLQDTITNRSFLTSDNFHHYPADLNEAYSLSRIVDCFVGIEDHPEYYNMTPLMKQCLLNAQNVFKQYAKTYSYLKAEVENIGFTLKRNPIYALNKVKRPLRGQEIYWCEAEGPMVGLLCAYGAHQLNVKHASRLIGRNDLLMDINDIKSYLHYLYFSPTLGVDNPPERSICIFDDMEIFNKAINTVNQYDNFQEIAEFDEEVFKLDNDGVIKCIVDFCEQTESTMITEEMHDWLERALSWTDNNEEEWDDVARKGLHINRHYQVIRPHILPEWLRCDEDIAEFIKRRSGYYPLEQPEDKHNHVIGSFTTDNEYYVAIRRGDRGEIPHVHIYDKDTEGAVFESSVLLGRNEYYSHSQCQCELDDDMRLAFHSLMLSACGGSSELTHYQLAITLWNEYNYSYRFKISTRCPQPDYREMIPYQNRKYFDNLWSGDYPLADFETADYAKMTLEMTGLTVPIYIENCMSYIRHEHPLWVFVSNGYNGTDHELIAISVSEEPEVMNNIATIHISDNDIQAIKKFISNNRTIIRDIANECKSIFDWQCDLKGKPRFRSTYSKKNLVSLTQNMHKCSF